LIVRPQRKETSMTTKLIVAASLLTLLWIGSVYSSPKSANDFTEREMKELALRMVQVAKARYETGRIESAEKILQATLEIDPGSQAARYYLGLVQEAVKANKDYIREWFSTNPPRPARK
jgi:Tfp pilus assembly protein PilF